MLIFGILEVSSEFDDYMRQNDIPPSTNTIHVDQFKVTWRSQVYVQRKAIKSVTTTLMISYKT